MAGAYKLLVEGKNDSAVIRHLMMRHHYNWDAKTGPRATVIAHEGVEDLLRAVPSHLKDRGTERLGIVLDADDRLEDRWTALCQRVAQAGLSLPQAPIKIGTEVNGLFPGSKLGVWVMPDNATPGELEHFLLRLIPEDDPCKDFASEVAEAAREKYAGQRCSSDKHTKSHIYTWLAWQRIPGLPFGTALNQSLLGHDTPTALAFADWFHRLFPEQAA